MAVCSDPTLASGVGALLSPPRNWPQSFKDKEAPLKKFLSKVLKGTRVRLVGSTPEGERDLREFKQIAGYSVCESEANPGTYVATPLTWLEHLERNPSCPAARLLKDQTPQWVEACRAISGGSPSAASHRTCHRKI